MPMYQFPLLEPRAARDTKDPCPVFDGSRWHIFGSSGSVLTETWRVLHATAPMIHGPWAEEPEISLPLTGSGVAAPGVMHENGHFFMFIQTEFMKAGGSVEFLTSEDGFQWTHVGRALHALVGTSEHGIYDPHPAFIAGERYLVYSGMPDGFPPQPDVYLAKSLSGSWGGPWLRMGKILDHEDVADHHNPRDHSDYEWGIEGAQLAELPDGRVLLNATCFLPQGRRGQRQRVFFAVADAVTGPFRSLGPVLEPVERGENGHATILVDAHQLVLCYQARVESTANVWRYGLAVLPIPA